MNRHVDAGCKTSYSGLLSDGTRMSEISGERLRLVAALVLYQHALG
jgi:hypothetical protein